MTKILIIKPSSLGDIIHTIPLIKAIKSTYPNCFISWLVNKQFRQIIESIKEVDEIILFDRNEWKRPLSLVKNLGSFFRLISKLKKSNFDWVIDAQGLLRSAIFCFLSGCKKKIGFLDAREGASFFYSHKIRTPKILHAALKNMYLLNPITGERTSCHAGDLEFGLHIKDETKKSIHSLKKENEIEDSFILMAPGARWSSKKWPAKYFYELAKKISTQLNRQVVVSGDPAIHEEWEKLESTNNNSQIKFVVGKTNLLEFVQLINLSDIMICNDSGPQHLAVALDKPVITLLGPTHAKKTGPLKKFVILQKQFDCSPCFKKDCPLTQNINHCMTDMNPNKVFEKIKPFIQNPQMITEHEIEP